MKKALKDIAFMSTLKICKYLIDNENCRERE